ncbi:ATP-binding cassette domain-containing protein [candidate division KSB1 bacterium]|nr:ATP-binding cassette domain-containing protein [candidate division KSB1 bacterium]
MIEVQQVTRFFGRVKAVDDVTFQVDKGEILGFLGPNAAGKTTTMRILTTFLPATSGKASVAGFDVQDQSMEVRKRIGYLPENPPLYHEMRVNDYLGFVASIKGVEAKQQKRAIDEVMDKTGISNVGHRVIKTLSKGYKQRVGLAQALVHNPEVLILDEPTVGLDPNQIIEVRELIKNLRGNHTIILSTHILPEVSMTCQRVVIINQGRVVAVDKPENLTTKLAGGQRLNVTLSGDIDVLKEKLQSLDNIRTIELSKDQNISPDQVQWIIESEPDAEIRPLVAQSIVQNGGQLFEMKPEGMSLEDVFLQLTTREEGTAS